MKIPGLLISLILLLGSLAHAQQTDDVSDKAADLEARLSKALDSSPEAASAMLELIDLYHANGRVYGLVRTAKKFINAHPAHPKHRDVMLKLIDGEVANSMNDDIVSSCRQFLQRYAKDGEALNVQVRLARTLERMNKRREAADSFRDASQRGGPIANEAGFNALRLYGDLNSKDSFSAGAKLAEGLIDRVSGIAAVDAGLRGVYYARRYNDWAFSNQIGSKVWKKNLPLTLQEKVRLHHDMGENYRYLKQYSSAVKSYQAARALEDNDDVHRKIIQAMFDAGLKATELQPLVAEYGTKYKDRDDRWWAMTVLCNAFHRDSDIQKATDFAARVLPYEAFHANIGSNYLRWMAEDPARLPQAEQVLKDAVSKNKDDAFRLRYILAFDLYRDRLKDEGKAKGMARELIQQSPSNDGLVQSAMHWLLNVEQDNNAFQNDVRQIVATMKKNGQLKDFQRFLGEWAKGAARSKELKDRANFVQGELKNLQNDAGMKLWVDSGHDQRGREDRKKLLAQNLSDDQYWHVAYHQAYSYRQHARGDEQKLCVDLYKGLAKRFPQKFDAASWWLEAASGFGTKEQRKEAAEHMLTLSPPTNDFYTWVRLLDAAEQNKDAGFARKGLAWINASQAKYGISQGSAYQIGDKLAALELEAEAVTYWKIHMGPDVNHGEVGYCADRILKRIEDPNQQKAFLTERLKVDSDHHGTYAAWLADIHFKAGEWDAFERILRDRRKVQDQHGGRSWRMGDQPMHSWVTAISGDKEMDANLKVRLLRVCRDMKIGRSSAKAQLALLEVEDVKEQGTIMKRLLAHQEATMMCWTSTTDWDYLMPYAQSAMGRTEYAEASTILTGMLNNIRSVDDGRQKTARSMVGQAFSRMGAVGLEIDANSPIAPLMQISLYLRLGDKDLALATYNQYRPLFDEHQNELPIELVAFAVQSHITGGGEENANRAEDILRKWLIKHGETESIPPAHKAQIQLLLGRNYFAAGRYEVARSEYTSVINKYPDTDEAMEAEFGVGESYMAQKVYEKAEEVFVKLTNHRNTRVVIRAEFLRGVLANRMGERDAARDIFRNVLERMPDVELANETLFNLAEVYGVEQRYMDQLDLLRTVGRLGRESKRWHAPGRALSIVVQDSDLGISRGEARIPVRIWTEPGGDEEKVSLASGGAGKGLFMTEIATVLGHAVKDDKMLQVTGNDTIFVDYPEAFKNEFKFHLLANNEIKIAADGELEAASSAIEDVDEETISDKLKRESMTSMPELLLQSARRPANQIKPGNLIYLRVKDSDRDLSDVAEMLPIKLVATSGDEVRVDLVETGSHSGIFEGSVRTGELPAGALASDSSIDHSPLMAIDHDQESMWLSEPDGVTPKWLTIDLKDLRSVSQLTLFTPDTESQAPVRIEVEGSHDGRFWYHLAEFPAPPTVAPISESFGPMGMKVYRLKQNVNTWDDVREMFGKHQAVAEAKNVKELSWALEDDGDKAKQGAYTVVWNGKFVQERAGGVRFVMNGQRTAAMVDGALVNDLHETGEAVDVYLKRGIHELTFFVQVQNPFQGARVMLARENLNTEKVLLGAFRPSDLDLNLPEAKRIAAETEKPVFAASTASHEDQRWDFHFETMQARHMKVTIKEFIGEAVAINHVEIKGDEETYIPTTSDVLSLSTNAVLELTAGDTATASYIDELTEGGLQRNRLLTKKLTATYYNGAVRPISYEFLRAGAGTVGSLTKDLMRIAPGERISIEVTDYDMDQTAELDKVELEVLNGEQVMKLTATESDPNSGVFKVEVDTSATNATDRLTVQAGDRVILRYTDHQNTFPGHSVPREAVVFVNEPSDARVRIVDTRFLEPPADSNNPGRAIYLPAPDGRPSDAPAGVSYKVPLTVEVYDPDMAKDSMSRLKVALSLDGTNVTTLTCLITELYGEATTAPADVDNWALYEGRFVGQVMMQLGGADSPDKVPANNDGTRGLIGWVNDEPLAGSGSDVMVPVMNLTGKDIVKADYADAWTPAGMTNNLLGRARLITDGALMITNHGYEEPVELLHVGEKLFVLVNDPDMDLSDERDRVSVTVSSEKGEKETIPLEETLTHSGIFTGAFDLKAQATPTADNFQSVTPEIETFFGDALTITYLDTAAGTETGQAELVLHIPVAIGTDGLVSAFSKIFGDEELAIQTQFHIAESYFEMFKSHLKLEREAEAQEELASGRRVLSEVLEDYPDPKYLPRILYLLGQFSQEMKEWDGAIASYERIVREFPEHSLAADSQYKLAQCYEEAGEFDSALESYVTLASTYPQSPLIANVMIRINEYFYNNEDFLVAAQVGRKFLERFQSHEWSSRMAFRVGQCFYKSEQYKDAGESFDSFAKRFPDDDMCGEALFWGGESYRMGNDVPQAFRRYNRCRWDFPESEAAKYARGRLALPEMLAQFEREANLEDE
ncbi:MAG: TolA-binding protein [Kiritimatiellia bacterium]|jgi:TolA-binding protein